MLKEKGLLLVISGPSGVGKGTICKELVKRNANMNISVSATTRKCRPGEVEGVNYFFKTKEEFQQMVEKGEFLEYMKLFNNNYYGTPRGYVEQELKAGNDIVLEIDYHGAMNVKKAYPQAVLIFIVPPRIEELKARLVARGSETPEEVEARLSIAISEITAAENYDYVVANDLIENAVATVESIVSAEKSRVSRNQDFIAKLKGGK